MSTDDNAMLARLDERVANVREDVSTLSGQISSLRDELQSSYVRLERYIRVELAVFGLIGVVLTALIGWALLKVLQ